MSNEELVKLYQNGNNKALDKLIEQNKRIIYKIANKFTVNNNSIDNDDLIQEETLGLMIAAKKYDFNNPKKAKFITYAIHWIYQKIYNLVVGHSTKDKRNKELNNNCTSLNIPVGEDGEGELQDIIVNQKNEIINIDEILMLRKLKADLEQLMYECNTLKEREVLKLYYGWNAPGMSIIDIADLYNEDIKYIRGVNNKAINKLRKSKYIRVNKEKFIADGLIDYSRFYIYNSPM